MAVTPPDVHMIEMRNPQTGQFVGMVLYLRFRVSHTRGPAADNVEVFVPRVWRRSSSTHRELVTTFLPIPLVWTGDHATATRIAAGTFRHCDLGYLGQITYGNNTTLTVTTAVQPFPVSTERVFPNMFTPGVYEFDIVLSGDNIQPINETWQVVVPLEWSDDEATMLQSVTAQRVSA